MIDRRPRVRIGVATIVLMCVASLSCAVLTVNTVAGMWLHAVTEQPRMRNTASVDVGLLIDGQVNTTKQMRVPAGTVARPIVVLANTDGPAPALDLAFEPSVPGGMPWRQPLVPGEPFVIDRSGLLRASFSPFGEHWHQQDWVHLRLETPPDGEDES